MHGRAAHAGLEPEKGINSLVAAAELITRIATFGDPQTGTTVTPTVATAGTADNVVPALTKVRVDARVNVAGEKERVEHLMATLSSDVARRGVEVSGGLDRPPMQESASTSLFALAQTAAADVGLAAVSGVAVGGGSDGNFTAAMRRADARWSRCRRWRRARRSRVRTRSTRWSTVPGCSPRSSTPRP